MFQASAESIKRELRPRSAAINKFVTLTCSSQDAAAEAVIAESISNHAAVVSRLSKTLLQSLSSSCYYIRTIVAE